MACSEGRRGKDISPRDMWRNIFGFMTVSMWVGALHSAYWMITVLCGGALEVAIKIDSPVLVGITVVGHFIGRPSHQQLVR